MTKTSHKKNRPFDFKLIELVQPHPVLYLRQMPGMSTYEIMKAKNKLWQDISTEMGYSVQFCLNRWNNLRGQFQKELKHCNELCPRSGIIRGSTWPYLNRMKFLECTVQANKPKREKMSKRKLRELQELEESVWKPEDDESADSEDMDNKFDVEDITDQVEDPHLIHNEYVGDENYTIIEEIAEEIVGTETSDHTNDYGTDDTFENYNKIHTLLSSFEDEALKCIERRLVAFLCKCQIRALSDQSIDDLFV